MSMRKVKKQTEMAHKIYEPVPENLVHGCVGMDCENRSPFSLPLLYMTLETERIHVTL